MFDSIFLIFLDHGLPAKVSILTIFFREHCGLQAPTSWDDPPAEISQSNWANMASVYTKVEDIDAFTGAMSEIPVTGGLVGPTLACILGQQFQSLMVGDR